MSLWDGVCLSFVIGLFCAVIAALFVPVPIIEDDNDK